MVITTVESVPCTYYSPAWCLRLRDLPVAQVAGRVAFSYQGSDFVRPISEAQPDISGLQLSEQERAMFLDLGPYVNPSYYVVQVRCGAVRRGCGFVTYASRQGWVVLQL
jgi:hypothetical protein